MVRTEYIAMKTDEKTTVALTSDLQDLKSAAKKFANDVIKLGGFGFGSSFFQWLACVAAIYLLILDRTNWKTEMLTQLLIPYIFFTLPSVVFDFIRGDPGKWVAFVAVVLRLFFPKHFPEWFEMPGALVLLLVVTPHLFAHTLRNSWGGVAICLAIACFLLQEHIQKSGGFRKSFTQRKGLSNSIGILLLMVYPVWALVRFII
ncbi:hypothetical protein MKW98_025513 [Papaver atlanticum]|uniref:Uncharacterized protein n=1 Tax=Papaver atlanticum TaxID=357466 RepID=A0AAD4SBP3_9MAGN|nr:hypothetical protein MKW98_025513 [Papaver atlanticum]